ncbi:MAG: hydantoinase B/oxoprolinase family protein, partial [Aestuariibacter sp.]|nr:hydantoinase B/oxoprolinase family protein [Aestuariibacter sp.]
MWNRLLAIVEEQGQVLIRTAFSPIVRECGDISAGIFAADGRMLAQAVTGTPGHINTMAAAVGLMLGYVPAEDMNPGDIYMTNDPWLASGHLNDVLLVAPVFFRKRLVAFTACTSHLYDLGGLGMGPQGSDIHDEGLIIPPLRLCHRGEVSQLFVDILKANSRTPESNEGDLYALIACCDVGALRIVELLQGFNLTDLIDLSNHIIETSNRVARDAIAEVPNGIYCNQMQLDGYDFEITIKATMTVDDDCITTDFSGSSPCSKFGINVPLNYTAAYSVFGIRCVVGPQIPNNAGSLSPFQITAPDCIVNAPFPAPVAMRHTIG